MSNTEIDVELAKINMKLDGLYTMSERSELTNNDAHAVMNTKQDILNGTVRANELAIEPLKPLPEKVEANKSSIDRMMGGMKAAVGIFTGSGIIVGIISKIKGWW